MQLWFLAHIHDVLHPVQDDSPPYGGLACGADVFVVGQGDRLAGPGVLAQGWSGVARGCHALAKSSTADTSGFLLVG